jgi:hypothetical protein
VVGGGSGLQTIVSDETPLGALDLDDDAIPLDTVGVPKTGGEGPIEAATAELAGLGMILSAEMMAILAFIQKKKKEEDVE